MRPPPSNIFKTLSWISEKHLKLKMHWINISVGKNLMEKTPTNVKNVNVEFLLLKSSQLKDLPKFYVFNSKGIEA